LAGSAWFKEGLIINKGKINKAVRGILLHKENSTVHSHPPTSKFGLFYKVDSTAVTQKSLVFDIIVIV
jgi:hypothetical protein